MEKQEARKKIRELKKTTIREEKQQESEAVWSELEQTEAFAKARVVLAYWSMEDEPHTHDFISRWAGEKCFLLPCIKGDTLELRRFESREKLVPGARFAIPEPVGRPWEDPAAIDLIIVPGVAFDKTGNRLGRGKGYYDRILKTSGAFKVGVCFGFQLLESVPVEAHDVPVDLVIAGK